MADLAELIFVKYLWAFELTGALLIIATVGAMVLAHIVNASAPRQTQREMISERMRTGARITTLPNPGFTPATTPSTNPLACPTARRRPTPSRPPSAHHAGRMSELHLPLAVLFTIGAAGVLLRRNAIIVFMCIELMLNAANLAFVGFAFACTDFDGQVYAFFTMVVAAARWSSGLRSS